ncbi:MAG: hypothetical protein AMXMBFR75_14700 [Candidatus Hinthialibacteria bacterium]|nr:PAS domain-containing protein [Betaproteobacteria bacterium PRO4]
MNGESLPTLMAVLVFVVVLIPFVLTVKRRDGGFFEKLALLCNSIFFPLPLNDTLDFKSEQNPIWACSAEQALTSILRLAALLAFLSFPFIIAFRQDFPVYTAIVVSLLMLICLAALRRSLNFRLRFLILSLTIYVFACTEIFYSGLSTETFIYFFFLIILTSLLGNIFEILVTLATLSFTIFVTEWLIVKGVYVPSAGTLGFFSESNIFFSLLIFNMASFTVTLPVTAVKRSLETSWQREVESRNLLEQERNLLEQRVSERTHQLTLSEEKHRKLVEQLPVVVYRDDLIQAHVKQYISPQAEPLLGYPLEEWAKNPSRWLSIIHPDDREIIAAIQAGHQLGTLFESERVP